MALHPCRAKTNYHRKTREIQATTLFGFTSGSEAHVRTFSSLSLIIEQIISLGKTIQCAGTSTCILSKQILKLFYYFKRCSILKLLKLKS